MNLYIIHHIMERQTTLMFRNNATNVPPGEFVDEYIAPGDVELYRDLAQEPDWRKKLSNFYFRKDQFVLDGFAWNSVEHYFHAQKFKDTHPAYYVQFTAESLSPLSTMAGAPVKHAGRKYCMRPEEITKWNGESAAVLRRAQEAKFGQNPDLRQILLLTRNAQLVHRATNRSPLVVETDLMNLRSMLQEDLLVKK